MEFVFEIILLVLGLSAGSFVNMLVYRTAENYGLRRKKKRTANTRYSFCDYCGRNLSIWENIPVISWLILGGKSRCCRKKLPIDYPIVELLTGIVFGLIGWRHLVSGDIGWTMGVELAIATFLIFSSVFDLKYMILPDFSTFILVLIAAVWWGMAWWPWQNLVAAFGAAGLFAALYLVTKGKGMGAGDIKLAVFIGLLLGIRGTVVALYLAFISGAVAGVVLIILRRAGTKSLVPFGPFLIGGTAISWWIGSEIWAWAGGVLF